MSTQIESLDGSLPEIAREVSVTVLEGLFSTVRWMFRLAPGCEDDQGNSALRWENRFEDNLD